MIGVSLASLRLSTVLNIGRCGLFSMHRFPAPTLLGCFARDDAINKIYITIYMYKHYIVYRRGHSIVSTM
jgi:hypothetical protein